MKYFIELLESYSRLKKRNLKLLEQQSAPNGQSQADGLIVSAKQAQGKRIQIPDQKPGVGVWVSQSGNNKGRVITNLFGGRILPVEKEVSVENYNKFVSYFTKEEPKEKKAGDEVSAEQPQEQAPGVKWWNPFYWASKFGKSLQLSQRPLFIQGIVAELSQADKEAFLDSLDKRFDGNLANYSTARIIEQNIRAVTDVSGNIVIEESKEGVDQVLKDKVHAALKNATDLISSEKELTPDQCAELKRSIIPVKGGRLIVKDPVDGGQGLVINDRKNFYKNLFVNGAKIKGCNLPEIGISEAPGGNNNIRGKIMEDLPVLASLIMTCSDPLKAAKVQNCSEVLNKFISKHEMHKEQNLKAFMDILQISEKYDDEFAISLEDKDTVLRQEIFRILGNNAPQEIVKRLQAFAVREYKIRRPDFVIPMGDVVGENRKGDVLEVYETREAAVEALKRQGFTDEDQINKIIKEQDMNEICDDERSDFCPKDKSRPYYTVSIGLKNYLNFKEGAHLGGISDNVRRSVMMGDNSEPSIQIRDAMAETLGQDWMRNPNHPKSKELIGLEKELSNIHSKIESLGVKIVIGPRGGIKKDSLEDFATSLENEIRKNTKYEEQTNLDILKKLKEYSRDGKNPEELKALIGSYVEGKLLKHKLADPKTKASAQAYIACNAFLSGGSADRCLFSGRTLQHKELLVCEQNSLFESYKNLLQNPDSNEYELSISDNGRSYSITHHDGTGIPKRKITTGISIKESGRRNFDCVVNNNEIRKQAKRSTNKVQDSTLIPKIINNRLLLEYITNSYKVIKSLVKTIRKDV